MATESDSLPAQATAALAAADIEVVLPTSPDFAGLHSTWIQNTALPIAFVRPTTADQTAAAVRALVVHHVPLVVRNGGHDPGRRSSVRGVVSLDLRRLNSISVAADRQTARVGGGVLAGHLLATLSAQKLTAVTGTVDTVGYVGWATMGGYGPLAQVHGMGMDQIVSARLVTAAGELIDAGPELLTVLRGGGASPWGVVVELQIKVYPEQKCQTSTILYDSTDLKAAVTTVFTNLQALFDDEPLPPLLTVQPLVFNLPRTTSPTLLMLFFWAGPATDATAAWLAKIAGLGPSLTQPLVSTTPSDMTVANSRLVADHCHGLCESVSLSTYSPAAIAALAASVAAMPTDPCTGLSIHSLTQHSPSTGPAAPPSVFVNRRPHVMLEILGVASVPEAAPVSRQWAAAMRTAFAGLDAALPSTYLPLTSPEQADLTAIYGPHLAGMVALKKQLDPAGVFQHSLPKLV